MQFIKKDWVWLPVLLYVIGFVIHNAYLSGFGSYEFELVEAKYILSGIGAVSFYAACFAYLSIKVNLSHIFDSLELDNLLPWLLRIVSLPYVIYSFLYFDSVTGFVKEDSSLEILPKILFVIATGGACQPYLNQQCKS